MTRHRTVLRASVGLGAVLIILGGYAVLRPDTRVIERPEYTGVIFGRQAADRALGQMLTDGETAYWTPSRAQVARLESRLRAHVAREGAAATALDAYRRQYFGFTRDDARRIYVVGFCDVHTDNVDWRREFVSTAETFGCHFEAEYDIASETISFYWTLDG